MRSWKRASLLVFVLLFTAYACDLSSFGLTGQTTMATSLAQTLSAILTSTPPASTPTAQTPTATAAIASAAPTSTSAPTITPTVTVTPWLTATPLPIYTPTPVVPSITVSVPTNCREGPGIPYNITGALLVGELAQVIAVDPTHNFWYIPNPDHPGDYCWVWGQYATISGPTYLLPVYTPPPSPTPTMTSTPSPDFDLSFEGVVTCSGKWWLQFSLTNTGQVTFQSISLTIKDTALDTSASALSDSFFDRVDCSNTTSRSQLLPGKTVTVSPVDLGYDPSGNKLKVSVTLCSEDGQNGFCRTNTISFKP